MLTALFLTLRIALLLAETERVIDAPLFAAACVREATPDVIDYARRLLASPAPENYVALYLAKRYKCGTKVAREIVRAATPENV